MQKKKKIRRHRSEDDERAYWARRDSTDYVDWSKAKRVRLPKLKRTTEKE